MAAMEETQTGVCIKNTTESNSILDRFLDVYQEMCVKQNLKTAPDKDALYSMMLNRYKDEVQKVVPRSRYIIGGKVDGRALKTVTMTTSMMKPSKRKQQSRVLSLPYLPESIDYSKCCQAIILNGHLFTPCLESPAKDSLYCKACIRNGFKYGLLSDRKDCEIGKYVQPKGKKKEILYGEYLQKQNIDIDKVIERIEICLGPELAEHIFIPDEYLVVPTEVKKKRIRPAKEPKPIVDADAVLCASGKDDEVEIDHQEPKKKKERKEAEEKAAEDDQSETEDETHTFEYDGLTFRLFMHEGKKYVFDDDDMEIYEVIDKDGKIIPKLDGFSVGEWNWEKKEPEFYREVTPDESDLEFEDE